MDVGVGLPATHPGVSGPEILGWAARVDAGPFSSVAIVDRLVYHNYESLVTLAACAAQTKRVRLTTAILLAPLRNAGVLAKEAATIDAISGGRLTLGLGVGSREDDFIAAPAEIRGRGRRIEETDHAHEAGLVGARRCPPTSDPSARRRRVPVGRSCSSAGARMPQYGAPGAWPTATSPAPTSRPMCRRSTRSSKRSGRPRASPAVLVSWGPSSSPLGPRAAEGAAEYITSYYAWRGPAAEQLVQSVPPHRRCRARRPAGLRRGWHG